MLKQKLQIIIIYILNFKLVVHYSFKNISKYIMLKSQIIIVFNLNRLIYSFING